MCIYVKYIEFKNCQTNSISISSNISISNWFHKIRR